MTTHIAGLDHLPLTPSAVFLGIALFASFTALVLVVCNSHGGHDGTMKSQGFTEGVHATYMILRYGFPKVEKAAPAQFVLPLDGGVR
ncbi:hypothetical protein EON82_26740 [bacterium]|nr:MAG: hypothetical protein EON82_26740 [bacterium]